MTSVPFLEDCLCGFRAGRPTPGIVPEDPNSKLRRTAVFVKGVPEKAGRMIDIGPESA